MVDCRTRRCTEPPSGVSDLSLVCELAFIVGRRSVSFCVSLLRTLMDKSEAQRVLTEQLARFSERSYAELVPLVETSHVEDFEARGASGTNYQVEVQFFWDDKPRGVVRVVGSIDDGGLRALVPLTQTFLVSRPDSVKA